MIIKTNGNNSDFWEKFSKGSWEENTFKILNDNLKSSDVFVDIGAWIGPISLFVAPKVQKCYSFEPDPIAFDNFLQNISVNTNIKNIKAYNKAITVDGKPVKLFSRYAHGDSGSSILKRVKSKNKIHVAHSTTFSKFIENEKIEKIDFIKMDIEGGEFFLLNSIQEEIKRFKPILLISFHFEALKEYYERKLMPFGILRRLSRLVQPKQNFINKKAREKMIHIIHSVGATRIFKQNGNQITLEELKNADLSSIDMILFKWD